MYTCLARPNQYIVIKNFRRIKNILHDTANKTQNVIKYRHSIPVDKATNTDEKTGITAVLKEKPKPQPGPIKPIIT